MKLGKCETVESQILRSDALLKPSRECWPPAETNPWPWGLEKQGGWWVQQLVQG